MSRPDSLCLYYISVSRPRFNVATSFMLSTSLLLGRSLFFRLRHHSTVLSLQAGRDSKLLVCMFSCRDVDIRSRPNSFFNHCNSCRDLKSMSRPFFSSHPVPTSFLSLNSFHSISYFWFDLTVFPFDEIYVVTSILCRDIIYVASYVNLCCDHVFLIL